MTNILKNSSFNLIGSRKVIKRIIHFNVRFISTSNPPILGSHIQRLSCLHLQSHKSSLLENFYICSSLCAFFSVVQKKSLVIFRFAGAAQSALCCAWKHSSVETIYLEEKAFEAIRRSQMCNNKKPFWLKMRFIYLRRLKNNTKTISFVLQLAPPKSRFQVFTQIPLCAPSSPIFLFGLFMGGRKRKTKKKQISSRWMRSTTQNLKFHFGL